MTRIVKYGGKKDISISLAVQLHEFKVTDNRDKDFKVAAELRVSVA